jgi:hypothetical protein
MVGCGSPLALCLIILPSIPELQTGSFSEEMVKIFNEKY